MPPMLNRLYDQLLCDSIIIVLYHKQDWISTNKKSLQNKLDVCMAGVAGLEPTNDGIKIRCLTDLAIPLYIFILFSMAGVAGFEPTITESESVALPLGDTPKVIYGVENGIRTHDLRNHNPTL